VIVNKFTKFWPLTLKHWTWKRQLHNYDVRNPGPAHKCGGFKPVNRSVTNLSVSFNVRFWICSSLDGIWTHTIDTLQHHSLSLTSSALDHATTSTLYITEWNQWEKVISSLDSYFCWSPPVVLGHTVCSIGPKYIFHTVVGHLLNQFGYHTVFKNIFDSAIWYINQ
jgi:hypothetical protein